MLLLVLSYIAIATGLIVAAYRASSLLPANAVGRIAFGFACTPFVVASLTTLMITIWPGVPTKVLSLFPCFVGFALAAFGTAFRINPKQLLRWITDLPPRLLMYWVVALCLVAHFQPLTGFFIFSSLALILILCAYTESTTKKVLHRSIDSISYGVIGICFIFIGYVVISRLSFSAGEATTNSDALQYLFGAKHLLSHRNIFEFSGLEGTVDGTLRGDAHGILWIAFLASALSFGETLDTSAQDSLARIAFQLVMLSYFASGVALASVFRFRGAILAAVILLLLVPFLQLSSFVGSRDAFRLAGLLLLMSFLLYQSTPTLRGNLCRTLLLASLLGAWALQGHGLSIILVPLITASWFGTIVALRSPVLRALMISTAIAVGTLLAASPVISAYYHTGSPLGNNLDAKEFLSQTPYAKGFEKRLDERYESDTSLGKRIKSIYERDSGIPSVIAVVTLIMLTWILFAPSSKQLISKEQKFIAVMLSVWFVGQTIVLLDWLPLGYFEIGNWALINPRYSMQWYVVAALLAAWGITFTISLISDRFKPIKIAPHLILGAALIGVTSSTYFLLERRWPTVSAWHYPSMLKNIDLHFEHLSPDCLVISEDPGTSFHSQYKIIQLYSRAMMPLFRFDTPKAVVEWLKSKGFCGVILYSGMYMDAAGPDTPFLKALNSDHFSIHTPVVKDINYGTAKGVRRIYVLK